MYQHIKVPTQGSKITVNADNSLNVPDEPVIPFIEGDGTGADITPVMLKVVDAAVAKAYGGKRKIHWMEVYAGEKSTKIYGPDVWLPEETLHAVRDYVVSIKGPLTTPVGGGIRSVDNMREMLLAGADKVGVNTSAVINPGLVDEGAKAFGSQCIVVAIDAKREGPGKWGVYTHGGRTPVGLDAVEWAKEVWRRGAGEILLTSMDRDGTRIGFDLELTRAVSDAVDVPVIASGGVGALEHLSEGIRVGGADAVLAASIFHYGEFTVGQAKALLARDGIEVRL